MKKHNKIKLLWWGDACIPTGFGDATDNILDGLYQTGKYDIEVVAVGYSQRYGAPSPKPYKVYPLGYKTLQGEVKYVSNELGTDIFIELLCEKTYDIVIIHTDIFRILGLHQSLRKLQILLPPMILYTPLDASPCYPEWVEEGKQFTKVVTYSHYAFDEFTKAGLNNLVCIPLGVDLKRFKPLPPSVIRGYKEQLGWDDNFVIMTVGRNQLRKCYPEMLMAFQEFQEEVPKSIFYCHTQKTIDNPWGWNIDRICKNLGIEKKVIFPEDTNLTQEDLNKLYNSADVCLFLHCGEGFGKCIVEAMAVGKSVVVSNNTSTTEFCQNNSAILIPSLRYPRIYPFDLERIRPVPDINITVHSLLKLYQDKQYRTQICKSAYQEAQKYSWDKTIHNWKVLIEKSIKKTF